MTDEEARKPGRPRDHHLDDALLQAGLAGVVRRGDYRKALTARILRSVTSGELRTDTDPNRLVDLLMGTITMPMLFFQDLPAADEAETIVDQVLSGFAADDRVADPAR